MNSTYCVLFVSLLCSIAALSGEDIADTSSSKVSKCELCVKHSDLIEKYTESSWITPDKRKPAPFTSFQFRNQNNLVFSGETLFSKPTALTFLYTRCTNPNKCPLVASSVSKLQKDMKEAGLEGRVRLVVMTYDPEFDSPSILKQFSVTNNIHCNEDVQMVSPTPDQKMNVFRSSNVNVNFNNDRVNIHGIQLIILDSKGRAVKTYNTVIWDNAKVISDMKLLEKEINP